MTQEEKNNTLLSLQCKHGVFANSLSKALSVGKCGQEMLNKNVFIAFNIDMLRRFKPFESPITNGYKVTFLQLKEGEEFNIVLEINDGVSTTLLAEYSGNASLEYVLMYLQSVINNSTNSHNYFAEINGNVLYLYSYDENQEFSFILDITYTDGDEDNSFEIIVESIEEYKQELLDLWNCISLDDFNKISKCILKEYNTEKLFNLQ